MKPLFQPLNDFILAHTARLFPNGFDILPADRAPSDWHGIAGYLQGSGRMVVSRDYSDRTVYADPAVNHAFRAWHDWTHYLLGPTAGAMDLSGETAVCHAQQREVRFWLSQPGEWSAVADRAARIIGAEIIGQFHHNAKFGRYPDDQYGFVVAYLESPLRALERSW